MKTPDSADELNGMVIDVGPRKARRWRRWVLVALLLVALFTLPRLLSIYIEALWFGSVGYAPVYWYTLRLKILLFVVTAAATFGLLRLTFSILARAFAPLVQTRRQIVINNQQVDIAPARVLRPLAWLVSIALALGYGFAMSDEWQTFARYLKQPATSASDPVFHRTIGFYLFTLPVYDLLSSWLSTIAFIALIAAAVYALATLSNGTQATGETTRRLRYMGLSCALAAYLLTLAWDVFLDRYPYLWGEHQTFSGVTYTEDHFVLPGLMIVAITLLVGALIALLNAFTRRGRLLLIVSVALPAAVYLVAVVLVPTYV